MYFFQPSPVPLSSALSSPRVPPEVRLSRQPVHIDTKRFCSATAALQLNPSNGSVPLEPCVWVLSRALWKAASGHQPAWESGGEVCVCMWFMCVGEIMCDRRGELDMRYWGMQALTRERIFWVNFQVRKQPVWNVWQLALLVFLSFTFRLYFRLFIFLEKSEIKSVCEQLIIISPVDVFD